LLPYSILFPSCFDRSRPSPLIVIDPTTLPWYNQPTPILEELALFTIGVAAKTAKVVAGQLENILDTLGRVRDEQSPFALIRQFEIAKTGEQLGRAAMEGVVRRFVGVPMKTRLSLADVLKFHGMGCTRKKGPAMVTLAHAALDLKTCSVSDLDALPQFGPKSARFFVLHTRPNVAYASLDTHILKWLGSLGFAVPKQTPQNTKRYDALEQIYLAICKLVGATSADLDINVWMRYSQGAKPFRQYNGNTARQTPVIVLPTNQSLTAQLGGTFSVKQLLDCTKDMPFPLS
jgi:hypothetical protein